ncbi:extracellular solute-binding protein [Paenibacillus gallinarum]|uniref:Extracellular solute-binding protein n=1 Tax=Paenibacillus gallinarum TaxID=2762232 RepID=A0ABR8T1L6_9BACL|nr:extracellular solute-binding protein [Paenibacillus gallinarum]MBD7969194.1 extracellular solute-binding protein [Paenibacillus gallinarum]
MLRKKSWYFIAIATIMIVTTGCNTSNLNTNSNSNPSNAADKIVFLTTGDSAAQAIQKDDRIIAEINNRLGIDLEVRVVPEASFEKVNVAMATGDYPDVVTINYPSASLSQWINEGLVIPLNDYLPSMPTVKETLERDLLWTAIDGQFYGYPFIESQRSNYTLAYRSDWLETLGLEPPQTLDEFRQVLKAITMEDPDRNGKDDTYGITAQKSSGVFADFNFVHYAYGLEHGDWVLNNQGEVAPIFEHSGFKQGLQYLSELWQEKLIDPEFLLNDTQQREQKFYQGKVGFMGTPLFRHVNRLETNLQKVNPQGKLGYTSPPAGPKGDRGMSSEKKSGLFTAVTSAAKNPEKAAQFIEFMLSKEGRDLLELGIEGIHYTKEGDKVIYNEEERAIDSFAANGWAHPLAWGSVVWPLTNNYLPLTEPQADRAKESVEIASNNVVSNLVDKTTQAEIDHGGVLDELFNQYYIDIITGKMEIDAGLAELSKNWRDQGGNEVLEAVQEAYTAQQ